MKESVTFYIRASVPKGHPFPIISWLIRLITFFDSSHVFGTFPLSNRIFHAHFNTILFEGPEYLNKVTTKHQFKIDVPKDRYMEMMKYFESIKGEKSGYFLQLFGVAFSLLFRLVGIKSFPNLLAWIGNSLTCSEVLLKGLEKSKILVLPKKFDYPRENFTEKDMVKFLDYMTKNPQEHCKVLRVS